MHATGRAHPKDARQLCHGRKRAVLAPVNPQGSQVLVEALGEEDVDTVGK